MHFNNDVLIEQTDSGSIRAHNTVPLTIGGHSGGANGANFYLSEFLIYNQVVVELDRQIMEGYLAHKWGLASSLPTGHLYKTSAPSGIKLLSQRVNLGQKNTGAFTHNLTGLGCW